jgi:hypothetical protein
MADRGAERTQAMPRVEDQPTMAGYQPGASEETKPYRPS